MAKKEKKLEPKKAASKTKTPPKKKTAPKKNVPAKKETKPKKEEAKVETPKEFTSHCGSTYDPSKKGTCEAECSKEYPENYAECRAHFKTQAKAKSRKKAAAKAKKPPKPVDMFKNKIGSGANMINVMLLEGATVAEIAASVETTEQRVRNHMTHLEEKKNVRIFHNEKGEYVIGNPELVHPDIKSIVETLAAIKENPDVMN